MGTRGPNVARSAALDVSPTDERFAEEGGTAPATHALRGHPRQLQAACARLLRPVRLLPVPLLPQRLHLPRTQPLLLKPLPRCARSLRGWVTGRGFQAEGRSLVGGTSWVGVACGCRCWVLSEDRFSRNPNGA